jgi:hypothetical protein
LEKVGTGRHQDKFGILFAYYSYHKLGG